MSYYYACPICGDRKMPPRPGEKHPVPCKHCPPGSVLESAE